MITADGIVALRAPASVGLLVVLLAWETIHPFFGFFTADSAADTTADHGAQRRRERLLHGLRNIGFGIVNGLAIRFVFLAVWIRAMIWSAEHQFGVLYWIGGPSWLRVAVAVFLLDAWTYAFHRLSHAIPFFWYFHRLHHQDREMDVTTANRFHLGEITLSSVLRVGVLMLMGCRLEELALFELMLFAVVQFHHANIGVPEWLDRTLRAVIVTPNMHKVHHSVVRREQNANYSSLFSWWDRLARTWQMVPDVSRIKFGVDSERET